MKPESLFQMFRLSVLLISSTTLFIAAPAQADLAILVDVATLAETNPEPEALVEGEDPLVPVEVGTSDDASYVSGGAFAVTGASLIDAATFVFDFGAVTEVTAATLIIPIIEVFPQNGVAPIQVSFFSDNGLIEVTDYKIGYVAPITEIDAVGSTELRIDVTGPINSATNLSQFVGFRLTSSVPPTGVDTDQFPAFTGANLSTDAILEFVPGPAPVLANDTTRFDGYTLEVPNISIPSVGEVAAQFKLVDPNNLSFQLTAAAVTGVGAAPPPLSGSQLLDCSSFSPPSSVGITAGVSTYSVISGILDVPSVDFNGEQITVRLEYIEGSDPWLFETLSIESVQSGPSQALVSALGGGILLEPSIDFLPLCHGWVLTGDLIRNRAVERNLISGETGAVYPFNTAPAKFTLDDATNTVFMTAHPETERLYKLDLDTGDITYDLISQTLTGPTISYTYSWALRDITLGPDGKLFSLMFDGEAIDPENQIPYSESQLWLGLFDRDANFLIDSLPLEEPRRIEYDPVRSHLFLANLTNLATFTFDSPTNTLSIVQGTDVSVGSDCTDFDVSPDGNRLAYTCPTGNYGDGEFMIADMDPLNYYNNDGEWYFEKSPVSATFSPDGTLLIGTDNERLYFYDVATHLILEDFELGLLEDETINKVRFSRDGQYIYIYLNNDTHAENSKFYWMPVPAISGTPL